MKWAHKFLVLSELDVELDKLVADNCFVHTVQIQAGWTMAPASSISVFVLYSQREKSQPSGSWKGKRKKAI